jgi:putative peptidoglycan lipid II flippase
MQPINMKSSKDKVKSSRGFLGSVLTVGSITVASRILGLVRDIIIARLLGAGAGADAFFVAFRIPNFLRRLFAEGAFSQAFVPVLAEYKNQRDHAAVRDLVASTLGALGCVLLLLTSAGILAAPWVIGIFAPGFEVGTDGKYELATQMLRITFPYLLFISLSALAAGALNTHERFGVPAFTPVLLNVAMIGCAIFLAPYLDTPAVALAWGVLLGGFLQLAFQIPFLVRLGLGVWPRIRRGHEGVRRVIRLMIPAVFGASVSQINLLINTLLASFLVTGSVTWLYFSDRLLEFPLGVFGVALGTVLLPRLSSHFANDNTAGFNRTLDWSLRMAVLIGVPAAIALAVLAVPLLTTLFQYGRFTPFDVQMAAKSLQAYAFGLVGFVAIKVLAPGYFSRQDTTTPVRCGVAAVVANVILSLSLVGSLAHVGLALAIAISAWVNAALLYFGLRRSGVYVPDSGWLVFIGRVVVAALIMGGAVLWLAGATSTWVDADLFMRMGRMTLVVSMGIAVYVGVLLATGMCPSMLRPPEH